VPLPWGETEPGWTWHADVVEQSKFMRDVSMTVLLNKKRAMTENNVISESNKNIYPILRA
jgi:hypothetical protein